MIDSNDIKNWRKWVLENHPSVKTLQPGYATICISPFGFTWFGESDGIVEVHSFWLTQKEVVSIGLRNENGWPHQLRMGEFLIEFQESRGEFGVYKLVRSDTMENVMAENKKFLEMLKMNFLESE